jgi:hypothetical protein
MDMTLSQLMAPSLHIFNTFSFKIHNRSFIILIVSCSSFYTLFDLASRLNIEKLPFRYLMHNLKVHEILSFLLFPYKYIPSDYGGLKSLSLLLQPANI